MEQQSYRVELMGDDPTKVEEFEGLLNIIVNALVTMELVTVEKFAADEALFIEVLREVFSIKYGSRFRSFGGKYHPPTNKLGPRYDLGLQIDEGDDGIYPIQVEMIGVPKASTTLH